MAPPKTCRCRLCGGNAKFLYSDRSRAGRLRRYGCQEPDCGVRWSERDGDDQAHLCASCTHWLLPGRCGLGFPEPLLDPGFADLCAAWVGCGERPEGIG